MGEADAQKWIIGSIVVTGAVVAWTDLKKTGKASPSLKSFIALFMLAAVLLIAASAVPAVAAGFAVLISIGVVTSRIGK